MAKIGRPLAMSAELRRQEILNVAEQLFGDQGFAQVTMADIAKACSMSKKTLYVYFADKRQLLLALVTASYQLPLIPLLDEQPCPIERLKQQLIAVSQHVLSKRHLNLYRLAIAERSQLEGITDTFFEMGIAASRQQLIETVSNIPQQCYVLDLSVEIMTDMLFGAGIAKAFTEALLMDGAIDFAQIEQDIHTSVDALFIKK